MLSLKAGIGPLLKRKQVSYRSEKKNPSTAFSHVRSRRIEPTVHHLKWCTKSIATERFCILRPERKITKTSASEHKKAELSFDENSKVDHHRMDFDEAWLFFELTIVIPEV